MKKTPAWTNRNNKKKNIKNQPIEIEILEYKNTRLILILQERESKALDYILTLYRM